MAAVPAQAVVINLIDQGGVTGSQAQQGFRIAADYWQSVLTNTATINLGVGYSALGANIIGQTSSTAQVNSVTDWKNAVIATKSNNSLDSNIVLPTLSPSGAFQAITDAPASGANGLDAGTREFDTDTTGANANNNRFLAINSATAKAIGLSVANPGGLDADITFSSNFNFDFDPTDGIDGSSIDFIATAIHEIGHALGFVSGVDTYDSYAHANGPDAAAGDNFNFDLYAIATPLDMFRYSQDPTNVAPGSDPVIDQAVGAPAYFSVDGGATAVAGNTFSTGQFNGDGRQASHWVDSPNCYQIGIMDPTECYGSEGAVKALDLAAFDAIGWNLTVDPLTNPAYNATTSVIYQQFAAAAAVPEPATWATMVLGLGCIGGALRRKRDSATA